MTQTALILGSSGRFGRHTAQAFSDHGWHVKRFQRGSGSLNVAAEGVDVIVNGWNPAYPDWAKTVPTLTETVIAAARHSGAAVLVPGNVYVCGADAPARFAQDTPHGATNPLGRIRVDMENAYRKAGVRTILLRAGDFLDTEASGNWFDMVLAKSVAKGRFVYPGPLDAKHAWAFLPDLAKAAVQLAEIRDQLETFEDVPFPGYTLSGAELAKAVEMALGKPVTTRAFPWWQLHLAKPVWPLARHLLEMRYLWSKPHWLDGAGLKTRIPDFQPTPVADALRAALSFAMAEPERAAA